MLKCLSTASGEKGKIAKELPEAKKSTAIGTAVVVTELAEPHKILSKN